MNVGRKTNPDVHGLSNFRSVPCYGLVSLKVLVIFDALSIICWMPLLLRQSTGPFTLYNAPYLRSLSYISCVYANVIYRQGLV